MMKMRDAQVIAGCVSLPVTPGSQSQPPSLATACPSIIATGNANLPCVLGLYVDNNLNHHQALLSFDPIRQDCHYYELPPLDACAYPKDRPPRSCHRSSQLLDRSLIRTRVTKVEEQVGGSVAVWRLAAVEYRYSSDYLMAKLVSMLRK